MSIKDEMKTKFVYQKGFVDKKKVMNMKDESDDKKRIDKLESCVRDKDKRISKLEDYFLLRNRLILSSILSVVCLVPIVWILSIYGIIVDNRDLISFDERLVMLVGMITIILGPLGIWMILIEKIWGIKHREYPRGEVVG